MKNKILLVAALAFSVYANAQNADNSQSGRCSSGYSYEKMAGSHSNLGSNSTTSVVSTDWVAPNKIQACANQAVCVNAGYSYKMINGEMFVIVNGTSNSMINHRVLKNGTSVLINGAVIDKGGNIVYLKNGDSIDNCGLIIEAPKNDQVTL